MARKRKVEAVSSPSEKRSTRATTRPNGVQHTIAALQDDPEKILRKNKKQRTTTTAGRLVTSSDEVGGTTKPIQVADQHTQWSSNIQLHRSNVPGDEERLLTQDVPVSSVKFDVNPLLNLREKLDLLPRLDTTGANYREISVKEDNRTHSSLSDLNIYTWPVVGPPPQRRPSLFPSRNPSLPFATQFTDDSDNSPFSVLEKHVNFSEPGVDDPQDLGLRSSELAKATITELRAMATPRPVDQATSLASSASRMPSAPKAKHVSPPAPTKHAGPPPPAKQISPSSAAKHMNPPAEVTWGNPPSSVSPPSVGEAISRAADNTQDHKKEQAQKTIAQLLREFDANPRPTPAAVQAQPARILDPRLSKTTPLTSTIEPISEAHIDDFVWTRPDFAGTLSRRSPTIAQQEAWRGASVSISPKSLVPVSSATASVNASTEAPERLTTPASQPANTLRFGQPSTITDGLAATIPSTIAEWQKSLMESYPVHVSKGSDSKDDVGDETLSLSDIEEQYYQYEDNLP